VLLFPHGIFRYHADVAQQQTRCHGKHFVDVYCSKPGISEEMEQQIQDTFVTVHL